MPKLKTLLSHHKKKIIAIVSSVLLAALALPMLFESRIIFLPSRQLLDTPADYGLSFENVECVASDGVHLHGWLIKPDDEPVAWVLFSHGNAGNVSRRPRVVAPLVNRGVAVLLYDYRGYGRSDGSPSENGTYIDGETMLSELVKMAGNPKRVFLFGRSLGGGVSYELAVRHPEVGGLVTDATFTSIPDLARKLIPIPYMWRLVRTKYDNLRKAPLVKIPRLVMHGVSDELIPYRMGEQLRDCTDPPSEFFAIEGAGHNDTFLVGGDRYADRICDFIGGCRTP